MATLIYNRKHVIVDWLTVQSQAIIMTEHGRSQADKVLKELSPYLIHRQQEGGTEPTSSDNTSSQEGTPLIPLILSDSPLP